MEKMDLKTRVKLAFETNKTRHFAFRHSYIEAQLKHMTICALVGVVYGILGFLFFSGFVCLDPANGRYEFGSLIVLSLLVILCMQLLKALKSKVKEEWKWERICEAAVLLSAIIYVEWGFLTMFTSLYEGRATNYIIPLLMFLLVTLFFHTSPQHYVIILLVCVVHALVLIKSFKGDDYDKSLTLNVIILGVTLSAAGILKYVTALKEFISKREAKELRQTMEANNEELTSINEDLVNTAEQLRNKNDTQRLFTASMNHELRSPLNGIIGLLQILKDDKTLNPAARENIENAFASSQSLIQIVNDLLDFSKLESGEFTIFDEPYDLRRVVSTVNSIEAPVAKSKGLNFTIDADYKMPCLLQGDGLRIQQIIVNIVSNGIKYTEKGFVKLRLSQDSQNILTIRVEDSGQGISKEAQKELFKPYKRINENKNKLIQGTGLGLSIVMHLVTQMHGTIEVESDLGKGSVFIVKLPVKVTDPSVEFGQLIMHTEVVEAAGPDFEGATFLCVDDNPVNLTVFKGLFSKTNAKLVLVSDGKQALEAVERKKYDILFLDHMMPGMDGVELFQAIRAGSSINKETPAVMLTANAGPEVQKRYIDMGFEGYVSKPILKEVVFKTINEILKR